MHKTMFSIEGNLHVIFSSSFRWPLGQRGIIIFLIPWFPSWLGMWRYPQLFLLCELFCRHLNDQPNQILRKGQKKGRISIDLVLSFLYWLLHCIHVISSLTDILMFCTKLISFVNVIVIVGGPTQWIFNGPIPSGHNK